MVALTPFIYGLTGRTRKPIHKNRFIYWTTEIVEDEYRYVSYYYQSGSSLEQLVRDAMSISWTVEQILHFCDRMSITFSIDYTHDDYNELCVQFNVCDKIHRCDGPSFIRLAPVEMQGIIVGHEYISFDKEHREMKRIASFGTIFRHNTCNVPMVLTYGRQIRWGPSHTEYDTHYRRDGPNVINAVV